MRARAQACTDRASCTPGDLGVLLVQELLQGSRAKCARRACACAAGVHGKSCTPRPHTHLDVHASACISVRPRRAARAPPRPHPLHTENSYTARRERTRSPPRPPRDAHRELSHTGRPRRAAGAGAAPCRAHRRRASRATRPSPARPAAPGGPAPGSS
jgi:hypothetical protein